MNKMVEDAAKKQDKFWSGFSQQYHATLYEEVTEYPSLVMRHNYILELLSPDDRIVVDIGCGPGEMLCDLMDRGYEVYGVDIAQGMLDVASKHIAKRHPGFSVDLRIGNIEDLDFEDNSFDCVICAGVIEYMETDEKALGELYRILKPGGTLIITVRNKACPFRLLDAILDFVKETDAGIRFLNRIRKALNMDPIQYISYRKHYPWKFDQALAACGFAKKDFRYFHFYPFFAPLDKLFPRHFIRKGLKMERFSGTRLGIMGSGYIVKAIKVKSL
jgi:ubiquinone/menaquinone biosynthesis C-methylase UbiE